MADTETIGSAKTRVKVKRKQRVPDDEKRRRKLNSDRQYQKKKRDSSVNIFSQITRWQDFKTANCVVDDEQAAQMLLDHYESWKLQPERAAIPSKPRRLSTPLRRRPKTKTKISKATTSSLADQDPIVPYLSQASLFFGDIEVDVQNEENGHRPTPSSSDIEVGLRIEENGHTQNNDIEVVVKKERIEENGHMPTPSSSDIEVVVKKESIEETGPTPSSSDIEIVVKQERNEENGHMA